MWETRKRMIKWNWQGTRMTVTHFHMFMFSVAHVCKTKLNRELIKMHVATTSKYVIKNMHRRHTHTTYCTSTINQNKVIKTHQYKDNQCISTNGHDQQNVGTARTNDIIELVR